MMIDPYNVVHLLEHSDGTYLLGGGQSLLEKVSGFFCNPNHELGLLMLVRSLPLLSRLLCSSILCMLFV